MTSLKLGLVRCGLAILGATGPLLLCASAQSSSTPSPPQTTAASLSTPSTLPSAAQPGSLKLVTSNRLEIGGASTSVAYLALSGKDWILTHNGARLIAMSADAAEPDIFGVEVEGFIRDIEVVPFGKLQIALVAQGTDGIAVVNVTNPMEMKLLFEVGVNYYMDGLTWTEGGGDIIVGNVISGTKGDISSLVTDGATLWIANEDFGIHRTGLQNLLRRTGPVTEADGTLKIDHEAYTLQYAGENPWGSPESLELLGGRLFVGQGSLGLGIFEPSSLEKVGGYNLYTDASVVEDWFIDLDVATAVQPGMLDPFTGMPDYNQASFEILSVWHGTVVAPTPWADFDRYGKWYYQAHDVAVADFGAQAIAYVAYGLGGLVAVDVTGYETATALNYLQGTYLGYAPGVPAHGPEEPTMVGGGPDEGSLFPHYGAGMLKEAGVADVAVIGNQVFYSDHFAGLVLLGDADSPDLLWHGPLGTYDNDDPTLGDGVLGDHWPDYEFVTSYDMSPHDPTDHESLPQWMYENPSLLVSGEVGGHGSRFLLNPLTDLDAQGEPDVFMCVGAGGFIFLDVHTLAAPDMLDRFDLVKSVPTTDEIGADPGGVVADISIGHTQGITVSNAFLYLADGPHGITAWKLLNPDGSLADEPHLVANSLQDEYPVEFEGQTIYPAPHAFGVVFDPSNDTILTLCQSLGVRRLDVSGVESGVAQVGSPLLISPLVTDIFEHNTDVGSVAGTPKQDHAYAVVIEGNLAFTADGGNGLTVYDLTKDPTNLTSGYVVGNLGGSAQGKAELGRSTGIALWYHPTNGKRYALMAAGPRGVGVVDATDPANMELIKVFEPIKLEDGKVGHADGRAVDMEVVGNYAFVSYDSFGVVCYDIADLIEPLPVGVDPTKIWKVESGVVLYDYRPIAVSTFRLKDLPGYESATGGALYMSVTRRGDGVFFHVAYGTTGLLLVRWTDPLNPVLMQVLPTPGEATAVTYFRGRRYVADAGGGLIVFK